MSVELVLTLGVALVTIALYAVFGGADFGGGVWNALASGERKRAQRETIEHAIGPVWETNHVWLIFAIVLLFTCFPPAFAAISTGLFVPLTLVLLGIILRGSAFAYRSTQVEATAFASFWGHVFSIASAIAPFFFGATVGGLAVGNYAWTSPFALAVGVLAVALCAQIAAVFLTLESGGMLQEDFRSRGMLSTLVLATIGALALIVARFATPALFLQLTTPHVLIGIGVAMGLGIAVLYTLWSRHYRSARAFVALEAVAVLAGWGAAQYPYIVPGVYTFAQAASPPETLRVFLWLTFAGALALVPSLALLFKLFKSERAAS